MIVIKVTQLCRKPVFVMFGIFIKENECVFRWMNELSSWSIFVPGNPEIECCVNPGKVWKPKEEEKVQINEDEKVETEWDEVLAQATEEELVDLAGLPLFCVLIVACFIQMQGRSSYMLQCYLCTMLRHSYKNCHFQQELTTLRSSRWSSSF